MQRLMPAITASRGLYFSHHFPSALVDGVLATLPFAMTYFARHPTFLSGWLQIGIPFALTVSVRLFMAWYRGLPTVSWDGEGLRIAKEGSETILIPWSDFKEYRFTWGSPKGLKVRRWSSWGATEFIDLAGFDDDQRATLLRVLDMHHVALPNKRLEPTQHMIKE